MAENKMKNWLVIFICFLFVPTFAYGEAGERIEKDGYMLHISSTKLGSDLLVTCEIKGGNQTDRLYVSIGLFDETGKTTTVQYTIKHYKKFEWFHVTEEKRIWWKTLESIFNIFKQLNGIEFDYELPGNPIQ